MIFVKLFVGIFIFLLVLYAVVIVFALAMGKAAAPKNERERLVDDYEQMKALHYFDSPEGKLSGEILLEKIRNFTSGCPVKNNK
jgi:hypothetical protein